MADYGHSNIRNAAETHEQRESLADRARQTALDAADRAETMAGELGAVVRERPYATLALAAGLAFAVGALWKLGHRRPQSRLQSLLGQLPELPRGSDLVPRRWR